MRIFTTIKEIPEFRCASSARGGRWWSETSSFLRMQESLHSFVVSKRTSILNFLNDEKTVIEYQDSEESFTRNSKMRFKTLVLIILGQMQKSIQRELVEFQSYLQSEGYSLAKASSAAFSKGIHKFSHGVFEGMIKRVVDFMYNECDDTQYWKGHTVLAVDGSTVEVSNDKKVIDE